MEYTLCEAGYGRTEFGGAYGLTTGGPSSAEAAMARATKRPRARVAPGTPGARGGPRPSTNGENVRRRMLVPAPDAAFRQNRALMPKWKSGEILMNVVEYPP
jgi:hypothetical protein